MNIWKFFTSLWSKLNWAINFIYTYVKPIYSKLVEIIKEVKETNLEDDAARKAVFQKITDFMQENGLKKIPDSILNPIIEIVYLLVKHNKD